MVALQDICKQKEVPLIMSMGFLQCIKLEDIEVAKIFTNFSRFIEPRLHTSPSCKYCSPQGLQASMRPRPGRGFVSLTLSRKTHPGSPVFHAHDIISINNSLAVIVSPSMFVTTPWSLR